MNILYIVTKADGGGAQKYVLELARHFGGGIAAGTENNELFQEARRLGLASYPLKHLKRNIHPWHDALAILEITDLIKKLQPGIVHLNSSKAGFLGSIAGKLAGKKIVFTAHGFFYFSRASVPVRLGYTALERFATLLRNRIITVSEEDYRLGKKYLNRSGDKLVAIHNSVSPIDFVSRDEARRILGVVPGKVACGTIAQYYDRKGLDILVRAVSLLPETLREKLQCVLIGDGPERQQLERLIAGHHLTDAVQLRGFIAQASSLLQAFDVFVLPSRREGFPYVLLEAMQGGLPIVATNVGGVSEALGDAGVLVPPDNPNELAKALTALIDDTDRRAALSQKALRRSQLFTLETMLSKTEKIYRSL